MRLIFCWYYARSVGRMTVMSPRTRTKEVYKRLRSEMIEFEKEMSSADIAEHVLKQAEKLAEQWYKKILNESQKHCTFCAVLFKSHLCRIAFDMIKMRKKLLLLVDSCHLE